MHVRVLALAALVISPVAFAQSPTPDVFQVAYAHNLIVGDSVINFTNAGTLDGYDPSGDICVNVYAFDPAEELVSCCACQVTPNSLNSFSARDLISNTLYGGDGVGASIAGAVGRARRTRSDKPLTSGFPASLVIELVATLPNPNNVGS